MNTNLPIRGLDPTRCSAEKSAAKLIQVLDRPLPPQRNSVPQKKHADVKVEEASEDSFPASDPPSWTRSHT